MNKTYLTIAFLILFFSCKKETTIQYPLVYTGDVTGISSEGAIFNGKIVNLGSEEIIEYGFVWDFLSNPTIDNAEKLVLSDWPEIGTITSPVTSDLDKGIEYYVRTFIRDKNNVTYGKEVTFTSLGSLGPELLDFFPKIGNIGDTLTITGKNFSRNVKGNLVWFGYVKSKVIKASTDTLLIEVPKTLRTKSSRISINVKNINVKSTELFTVIVPVINNFLPKSGSIGTEMTIYGENFSSNPNSLYVYFDFAEAKILFVRDKSITVLVPEMSSNTLCNIMVKMNNQMVSSTDKFEVK